MKQDLRRYELEGLCMTCNHARSCSYLAGTEGPIWRCEEFDDSGPAGRESAMALDPRPPCPAPERAHRGGDGPRGLCSNCDNLAFCTLPGAREGAWFCEEYR